MLLMNFEPQSIVYHLLRNHEWLILHTALKQRIACVNADIFARCPIAQSRMITRVLELAVELLPPRLPYILPDFEVVSANGVVLVGGLSMVGVDSVPELEV
mmetsp:Transcript_1406/g.2472  ORF Transcript_1406/g.2472 Transcript_1406/m.2472 type:complete len:101 (+) Transcript_1406:250-552(+)